MIRNHSRHGSRFPITLGGGGGYSVAKSLRFRSSASAYLNRTPATATNRTTWTWSAWVKRGSLGVLQPIFSAGTAGTAFTFLGFTATTDQLVFTQADASITTANLSSTAVYRDPAAWYHIVAVWNTTSGTATLTGTTADRLQLWVNGVQLSSFSSTTVPVQNTNAYINNTVVHYEGLYATGYFDGEMAEVNFVDGQALAPTAFGASSTYNQWLPIKYAGTYGTNGFYLPFTNTASTSTLVADSSGNANNWTPNNISLTAGSTYDSLTDVPTLTSTTVANYAVLNPLDSGMVLSNANLTTTTGSSVNGNVRATIGVTSGKWYWEVTQATANEVLIGVANSSASLIQYLGQNANGWSYDSGNGQKYNNGIGSAYGATFTTSDVIGIALDMTAGTLVFYKNNTSQGTAFTGLTGTLFPAVSAGVASTAMTVNFGQQPFVYTAPTGFLPLNTYNI